MPLVGLSLLKFLRKFGLLQLAIASCRPNRFCYSLELGGGEWPALYAHAGASGLESVQVGMHGQ
jgi:hypothetical protein